MKQHVGLFENLLWLIFTTSSELATEALFRIPKQKCNTGVKIYNQILPRLKHIYQEINSIKYLTKIK